MSAPPGADGKGRLRMQARTTGTMWWWRGKLVCMGDVDIAIEALNCLLIVGHGAPWQGGEAIECLHRA